jgi:hypothetical protein
MDDLILWFFTWSNQSIDNFFITFALLWFFLFFLSITVSFFLSKKWLQLYAEVYSKHISFLSSFDDSYADILYVWPSVVFRA